MQATNFSSPTLPLGPSNPCWLSSSCSRRRPVNGGLLVMSASGGRRDYGGRIVDENMILLRMRIRELKISEMSQEPPASWMEWEKKYYTQYDEDVCEAVGLLQSFLLSIRPSLALGMAALVVLSVPFSAGVLFFHALEMAKAILQLI
ncbi:hypothetical protein FH972_007866 [Carpinus fangiana]|uniref:Mediator of RNA polymerase II transcription subunit 18 n=1 Tax=Carpinus fangiana TaxID=176857 RepID=A0A5N6QWZ4_9ROSI|nr:hypothetical protein FH972_007866 [Carpinus fangiana]